MNRSVDLSIRFVLCCGLTLAMFAQVESAAALSVLYSFKNGDDGAYPTAGLIMDSAGNLFGTTVQGGIHNCDSIYNSCGTVFELMPDGTEKVLYRFKGEAAGENPSSSLFADQKGDLYGTTPYGGIEGKGTVFELTSVGKEKTLYFFKGGATDGRFPYSTVVRDAAGNLYGTTTEGGSTSCPENPGCGTVFKLTSDGTETVLYAFQDVPDGAYPSGPLLMDRAGNLYGTTQGGGAGGGDCPPAGCGTVFKVTPAGAETVLHFFQNGPDGKNPESGVIVDDNGNLYGTTQYGGTKGKGTVFKIATDGTETVLHAFGSAADGSGPVGGLAQDENGSLYGTTEFGGAYNRGTIFKIAADGTETVLDSFACRSDGCRPQGSLLSDQAGNLYGMAYKSGPGECLVRKGAHACGTIFKINKAR